MASRSPEAPATGDLATAGSPTVPCPAPLTNCPANRTGGEADPTFRPGAWLRKQDKAPPTGS